MKTTIDKAGRVVIPSPVREKAGLRAGMALEVVTDGFEVRLVRSVPRPKIIKRGKRRIVQPSVPFKDLPDIDIARLIDEERDRWPL